MIEAELTCVCRRIELPDLGLVMTRGEKKYLPYDQCLASMDLHSAQRNGAIAVRPIKRYDKKRVGARLPQPARTEHTPRHLQTPNPRTPDVAEVVGKIPEGLTREQVASEVETQLAGMEARLLAAFANTQPQVVHVQGAAAPGIPAQTPGTVEQDGTPVFIPGGLVAEDVKGDIKTEKSESKGSGVTDAAAALKAARKKKRDH